MTSDSISDRRRRFELMIRGAGGLVLLVGLAQTLQEAGVLDLGFRNWRPTLYAYCLWATALCWGQVALRGEAGILPLVVIGVVQERFIIKGMAAGAVK